MSDYSPKQTFLAKPGSGVPTTSGSNYTVVLPSPRCFVDSHAHIENGACAPLPLLWGKTDPLPRFSRKWLDGLAKIFMRSTGTLQVKSTAEIGTCAVAAVNDTFGMKSEIGQSDLYKNSDLFSLMVIQMMDMEYAHIAGFEGQTIYHEDETPWYFYKRQSGMAPENKGKKVPLPGENEKTFSVWKKQLDETITAIKSNPFRLIGMYNYEPRRWNWSKAQKYDKLRITGAWNKPFENVLTKSQKGVFIGFKMYPPLGYKPLDERLPYMHTLKDGDCFYGRCMKENIPILAHCSPGGMTSHELPCYWEFDSRKTALSAGRMQTSQDTSAPTDETTAVEDGGKIAENHFYNNYVHPAAWRKVLQQFPKLKLCLAHFGGDMFPSGIDNDWVQDILKLTREFPNVYTDVSCWKLSSCRDVLEQILSAKKYEHIKDRLLFGTDWYMTLPALGGKSYQSFCNEFYEFFNSMPDGRELWIRFTFLNPFEFYGFNNKAVIDNLNLGLKDLKANAIKRDENYQKFNLLQKEYENQRKRLQKYKKA